MSKIAWVRYRSGEGISRKNGLIVTHSIENKNHYDLSF
jgi:hypothetical protein